MYEAFFAAGVTAQSYYDRPEMASRPFDKKRSGGVLSEGAGFVVLEDLESALKRDVRIYGEIKGHSVYPKKKGKNENKDVIHGMEVSMQEAMKRSGIDKSEIDYICAHAPSDSVFDTLETTAIKQVFGHYAYNIPVSSIKSMIGNPISAAGPMQLLSVMMSITKGIVPPTINYEYPDPDCDLDYVPNYSRKNKIDHALIDVHGLDGTNAALVVKRYMEK